MTGVQTCALPISEVLKRNGPHIDEKVHAPVELKYILDVRDFPDSPFASLIIHDFSIIERDPEVDIVVETIGGAKIAGSLPRELWRREKAWSPLTKNWWQSTAVS